MSNLKNTIKILYGLGNPSPNYDKTLHSIGKIYINHLARVYKADFKQSRGKGFFAAFNIANRGEYALIRNSKGEQIALFKSDSYMNLSGVPYKQFLKNCDTIQYANQYIVHDDLESKPGKFKIKNGGSPEGHNGLKSIIDSIGSKDFQRLKIGIGRPDSKDPEVVANYVTSNISSEEYRRYKEEIFPQIDEFLKKNNIL
ncbi:hypothetical protein ABPG74_005973 [Tetrahymena malaccensis]